MNITLLKGYKTHQIPGAHVNWTVSLVTADSHINLPQGFVDMHGLTYTIYHPKVSCMYILF